MNGSVMTGWFALGITTGEGDIRPTSRALRAATLTN